MSSTDYIKRREAFLEAEKEVKWETISENDFKATVGDYFFRVEALDVNKFWWSVSCLNEDIGDVWSSSAPWPKNAYAAKQVAILCMVDHKLKNEYK